MWDFLTPANLITFQREAAIRLLDEEIHRDWQAGYGPDVDSKLDRRFELQQALEHGIV